MENDTKICREFYKEVDIRNARHYKLGDKVDLTGIVCREPDLLSGKIPILIDDVNSPSECAMPIEIHVLSNHVTKINGD
jgi:hypothetical protein